MADDVDPRRVADDDGDGRGDYAPPSLQEVARRRAIQTALVGLGIDVAVALSVLWLSVVDTLTTGEAWAQENLPKATLKSLDDPVAAVTGVQTGLYDAAAADLPVMKYLCSNSFTDCQVSIEIPTGEQYGIVISKDNPGLTAAINEALSALKDDGTIDDLEKKWFGTTL